MQVWSATGRRKRATAQVRICSPGTGTIKVNQVDAEQYLQGAYANILKPFETLQLDATYDIFIRTEGGGLTGQSDAIRLGCARALCMMNPEYRSHLKVQASLLVLLLRKSVKSTV